jgi:hypothetical protein
MSLFDQLGIPTVDADVFGNTPSQENPYRPIIEKHASAYGVDPNLLEKMMHTESAGNPKAISPKGAQGLMQIMPKTWEDYSKGDPFDPEENIRVGAEHFSSLIKQFNGDVGKAVAAYNAGVGNIRKGIIPQETQDYMNKVLGEGTSLKTPEPVIPTARYIPKPGETPPLQGDSNSFSQLGIPILNVDTEGKPLPEGSSAAPVEAASVEGLLKRSTAQFLNTATGQLPQAALMKATGTELQPGETMNDVFFPGKWNPEKAQGYEKLGVGIGQALGYIGVGGPKAAIQLTSKAMMRLFPFLSNALAKTWSRRIASGMVREGVQFGVGATTEQAGNIAMSKTPEEAAQRAGQAFVEGATTGGKVGLARGAVPTKRILRIAVGAALLRSRPGSPEENRDIWDEVSEGAFTAMMLWHGYPKSIDKLEKDLNKELKDNPEVEKQANDIVKDIGDESTVLPNEPAPKGPPPSGEVIPLVTPEIKAAHEKSPYRHIAQKTIELDASRNVPYAKEELEYRNLKAAEDQYKASLEIKVSKNETKNEKYTSKVEELKQKLGEEKFNEILKARGVEDYKKITNRQSQKNVITQLEKSIPAEEVSPTEKAPEVEIPEFKNTEEAIAFGENATPEQMARLNELAKKADAEGAKIIEEFKKDPHSHELQTALAESSFRTQLLHEAVEWRSGKNVLESIRKRTQVPPKEAPPESTSGNLITKGEETPKFEAPPSEVERLMTEEEGIGLEDLPTEVLNSYLEKFKSDPEKKAMIEAALDFKNIDLERTYPLEEEKVFEETPETPIEEKVINQEFEPIVTKVEKSNPKTLFKNIGLEIGKFEKTGEVDEERILARFRELEDNPGTIPPEGIDTLKELYNRASEKWAMEGINQEEGRLDDLLELSLDEIDRTDMESWRELHPKPITLDMLGLQQVYEKSMELLKASPSYENLQKIARGVVLEGKTKYREFRSRMKEIVGDLWEDVKQFIRKTWKDATTWGDKVGQRGMVSWGKEEKPVEPTDNIVDKVVNRLSQKYSTDKKLSREYAEKRALKQSNMTKVDLEDIQKMGMYKGLSEKDLRIMSGNTFGFKKRDFTKLSHEEADKLKIKLAGYQPDSMLPEVSTIRDNPNVSDRAKQALNRAVKLYDADSSDLQNYIAVEGAALRMKPGEFNDKLVDRVTGAVVEFGSMRNDNGKMSLFSFFAPAMRVVGNKFVEPFRRAEWQYMEAVAPYYKFAEKIFDGLTAEQCTAITRYREGKYTRDQLEPELLRRSDLLTAVYKKLYNALGITQAEVEKYSPRVKKFSNENDIINWVFSAEGIREFKFWAENRRTGELKDTEENARLLLTRYIRSGFRKKFFNPAIQEIGPLMKEMSKERRIWAAKWINTVIRKRPTTSEKMVNRSVDFLGRKFGFKGDEGRRYLREFASSTMDLNYAAFMGLRPKLAIRNWTQQWLIVNEYGTGAYLKGRMAAHSAEIKNAVSRSDVMKTRLQEFISEESAMGASGFTRASKQVRDTMLSLYRVAENDNTYTAFATGYLKAKTNHPNLPESYWIKAGEKCVANTQFLYGVDLPYIMKTPEGKLLTQYSSWGLWYADHLYRMVKERNGAGAARTAVQFLIFSGLAYTTGINYTNSMLIGAMPQGFGYVPGVMIDVAKLMIALWPNGQPDQGKQIERAAKNLGKSALGLVPGSSAFKEIKDLVESGDVAKYLTYMNRPKKEKGGYKEGYKSGYGKEGYGEGGY